MMFRTIAVVACIAGLLAGCRRNQDAPKKQMTESEVLDQLPSTAELSIFDDTRTSDDPKDVQLSQSLLGRWAWVQDDQGFLRFREDGVLEGASIVTYGDTLVRGEPFEATWKILGQKLRRRDERPGGTSISMYEVELSEDRQLLTLRDAFYKKGQPYVYRRAE